MSLKEESSYAIGHIVQELTNGRPYVFVVMPYKSGWDFFVRIKKVVSQAVGLACIRADEVPGAGHDLLAKIHLVIERAELVIAEISTPSPNVFYEVGYAVGVKKPLLLLAESKVEVPTDLKGLETIQHGGDEHAMELFDRRLHVHVKSRVNSQVALLRDMLEADNPRPAYIVASPKYPGILSEAYEQRTYGDNLGILGLISAFGSMMGESAGVELISAQFPDPDLPGRKANLYLIASPKSNPLVEEMLKRLQKGREPNWLFDALPGEKREGDWQVALYRTVRAERVLIEGEAEQRGPGQAVFHKMDYGIIVRGPHPDNPDRLVLIMAGPHSLGTGAACLAVTKSPLIQQIKAALPSGVDIAEKRRTFWVLVQGKARDDDGHLDVEGVKVVEAGVYD